MKHGVQICIRACADLDDASTDEGDSYSDCVDGQLELEKLGDAVVDVTSPHDRLDDAREIVVGQYDVRCFLGHVGPSHALGNNIKVNIKVKWDR